MEFDIKNVDFEANVWDVKRAIAAVLHAPPFAVYPEQRPLNFQVKLNKGHSGIRNDGTGQLTLHSRATGRKFLEWLRKPDNSTIKVGRKTLKLFPTTHQPPRFLVMTLAKAPYIDPGIDEERQQILRKLDINFRISAVQIGTYYREHNAGPKDPRAFSIEWETKFVDSGLGYLRFEWEHKLLRAKLGDPMTESIEYNVVITFASIKKLAIGYDCGNQFLCFDLFVPPTFEETEIHRLLGGDEKRDSKKSRRRIAALHPGHEVVAPYAHGFRLVLSESGDLDKFARSCVDAGLRPPIAGITIDASRRHFFSRQKLDQKDRWVKKFSWRMAFQVEALLHNGLLNTDELWDLRPEIDKLYIDHGELAAEILRHFAQGAKNRPVTQTARECFRTVLSQRLSAKLRQSSAGKFFCHHVTFTPTRMLLEGPLIIQSNRVLRLYKDFEDHFLRVDFRDESRLQYRWDREVDGASFVRDRVGSILKNGFELAGRRFEFLAYSSSALRSHAVWFINPFKHPSEGYITADGIRNSLGNFSGVIQKPSKYAARIAQAFSATDPSVRVHKSQWEEMEDIPIIFDKDGRKELGASPDTVDTTSEKPADTEDGQRKKMTEVFTDGVGTISEELGDMIWNVLCEPRMDHGLNAIKPSAYQIRFLGYKGVVAIDQCLKGVKMRLRPSMNKFQCLETEYAEIEIVRAFDRPNALHLNRPLIMVLEDRAVKKECFMALQERVVANTQTAHDSIDNFSAMLEKHRLCANYRLSSIMLRLKSLGLELKSDALHEGIDNPFLARVRSCAINDVLRDVKHRARIPIPGCFMLVGIADEGPAYVKAGHENVYTLPEGKIYACVQQPNDPQPTWIKGPCVISRSPVVHPGDVQRVYAIGKPPKDKLCLFAHLKNVVVLPSVGRRSLASCLAGGDLDGDMYDLITPAAEQLIITEQVDPALYPAGDTLDLKRPSTVDDICDFIVEYINSDVVGLIADKHLIIADQSRHGTKDSACLTLAQLHSKAVDYPKNGLRVNIDDLPRNLVPYVPDWHASEVAKPRKTDYYVSTRALGYLYRAVTLETLPDPLTKATVCHMHDPVSKRLKPLVQTHIQAEAEPDGTSQEISTLFEKYVNELKYITTTFTLSDDPDISLLEEEVVVGTISAQCSQHKWRSDRRYALNTNSSFLAVETKREITTQSRLENLPIGEIKTILARAWAAWDFGLRRSKWGGAIYFGAESFGLIALDIVLSCLEILESSSSA